MPFDIDLLLIRYEPVRDKTNKVDQNMDLCVLVILIELTMRFKLVHTLLFCCDPFSGYWFSKGRRVNEIYACIWKD